MTDLDINCLPLRALKKVNLQMLGRTSRDKFSELDKHIPLTRSELWFHNEASSMINAQESRGMRGDSSFHV